MCWRGPNNAFGIFMQVSKVTNTVTLLLLCNMIVVYSPYINALHDLLFNSDFVLKSEQTQYRVSLLCDRGDIENEVHFLFCCPVYDDWGRYFSLKCHQFMPISFGRMSIKHLSYASGWDPFCFKFQKEADSLLLDRDVK